MARFRAATVKGSKKRPFDVSIIIRASQEETDMCGDEDWNSASEEDKRNLFAGVGFE